MICFKTVLAAVICPLLAGSVAFASDAVLEGVATYRERIALSPEATLEAVLEDVSLADAAAVEIGRFRMDNPGNPPFSFAIPYDTDDIIPANRYSVSVTIRENDRLRFLNDTAAFVLTQGAPDFIELVLTGAGSAEEILQSTSPDKSDSAVQAELDETEPSDDVPPPIQGMVVFGADGASLTECTTGKSYEVSTEGDFAALEHAFIAAGYDPGVEVFASLTGEIDESPDSIVSVERFIGIWPDQTCENANSEVSLTNTYWKILTLEDTGVEFGDESERSEPHMVLRSDESRFSATVGCNQFTGGFETSGSHVKFGLGAGTLIACQPPIDTWEKLLGTVLRDADTWTIADGTLEFFDEDGKALATMVAVLPN